MSLMAGQRFYEDDEAEEILRLAASISSPIGQMTYERLVQTAAELGITPEAVEAAEKQVAVQRTEGALLAEFDREQRTGFWAHLGAYVGVNLFLVLLYLRHPLPMFWPAFPMLGWGFGLLAHSIQVFYKHGQPYQDEYRKWRALRTATPSAQQEALDALVARQGVHVGIHMGCRKRERLQRLRMRLDALEGRDPSNLE